MDHPSVLTRLVPIGQLIFIPYICMYIDLSLYIYIYIRKLRSFYDHYNISILRRHLDAAYLNYWMIIDLYVYDISGQITGNRF